MKSFLGREKVRVYLYEAMDKAKERLREKHPMAFQKWWRIIDATWESTLYHDLHAAGYFFNPRHQYSDSPRNDGKVLQGTINVISRLSRSTDERIDAMMEQRFAEREALSPPIDVDELLDEEHPLNAWVETRQERDVPEFNPRNCSWAEGELDGVEARDPELRVSEDPPLFPQPRHSAILPETSRVPPTQPALRRAATQKERSSKAMELEKRTYTRQKKRKVQQPIRSDDTTQVLNDDDDGAATGATGACQGDAGYTGATEALSARALNLPGRRRWRCPIGQLPGRGAQAAGRCPIGVPRAPEMEPNRGRWRWRWKTATPMALAGIAVVMTTMATGWNCDTEGENHMQRGSEKKGPGQGQIQLTPDVGSANHHVQNWPINIGIALGKSISRG
ncbi:hypothetical protein Taro_017111 [Colocasia esculenta]|uniref:Uncharacterized protein n=1 Tax=Colocasia esculenta TaxID=4460 RepID=A0A843US89_COLES|nr:hypothetical protein [Colocasia esculenta]